MTRKKTRSIREELEIPEDCVLCNVGSWGPLCRPAYKAMSSFEEDTLRSRHDWAGFAGSVLGLLADARRTIAQFIGANPDEIALCESTTQALNIALWGLDLNQGDEIVFGSMENPAAKIVMQNYADRNDLVVKEAQLGFGDTCVVDAFSEMITSKTKVFVVSHVSFSTGACANLQSLSALARHHDIFLLVDGVQAIATIPVDVKTLGVDAYAMALHKFACGPDGSAALYVKPERLIDVKPTFSGVCSTTILSGNHSEEDGFVFLDTAERYEVSTRSFSAFAGGKATLDWLSEGVGQEFIYSQTDALRKQLWDSLSSIDGIKMVSHREWTSGVIAFESNVLENHNLIRSLVSSGVHARSANVDDQSLVRLSVGFWNSPMDIDRAAFLVEALPETRDRIQVVWPDRLRSYLR